MRPSIGGRNEPFEKKTFYRRSVTKFVVSATTRNNVPDPSSTPSWPVLGQRAREQGTEQRGEQYRDAGRDVEE